MDQLHELVLVKLLLDLLMNREKVMEQMQQGERAKVDQLFDQLKEYNIALYSLLEKVMGIKMLTLVKIEEPLVVVKRLEQEITS